MYAKQPKKLLIMNILDILRKYSDEEHRLSQREIGDLLRSRLNPGTGQLEENVVLKSRFIIWSIEQISGSIPVSTLTAV